MRKFFFILILIFVCTYNVHTKETIDILILPEAARSSDYLSKIFAIDLLGDVADENYKNFFILALNNERDSWLRYYAALALLKLNMNEQIIFELRKMLTDILNEPWLREKVAEMLYNKTGKKFPYRNKKDAIVLYEPKIKNQKLK